MRFLNKIYHTNKLYLANLSSTFISQSINALTIIILTPLLSTEMGLSNFGIYGVILSVITFSTIFDFGFNIGLLRRYIHLPNSSSPLLNSLLLFYLFLLLLFVPSLYFLFSKIIHSANQNFLILAILASFLVFQNIVAIFFDTIIQGIHLLYVSKLIRAAKLLIESLIIIFSIKKISLEQVLLITVLVNFTYILSLYFFVHIKTGFKLAPSAFSFKIIAEHFTYCIWYFLSSLASVLILNTQIFTINYLIGSAQAAKYLVISKFYDIIRLAATNFTQVLFPNIIQIEVEQNWIKLKSLFLKMLTRVTAMVLLIVCCLYWVGPIIFSKWSKINDHETILAFKLFSLLIGSIIIDNVSVIFLNALKLNKIPTFVSILQGVLGILFSYYFVKEYKLIGFVYGAGLSFVLTNMLFNSLYLIKCLNYKIANL